MKKIWTFLALVACAVTQLAFANSAIVTSLTGTVTAQTGTAAARTLRQGDEVVQGATVTTAANSSAVLRFADGQVAALTSNSQMAITEYKYESQTGSGSVLLSLVRGGMRAITGLIGKANPTRVAYRAGTATIGIRGTDVTVIHTPSNGDITVTVTDGSVSFTYAGKTLIIPAGQGVNAKKDGTTQQDTVQQIISKLQADVAKAVNELQVEAAIQQAARGGDKDKDDKGDKDKGDKGGEGGGHGNGNGGGTPGGGGGGGGGGASRS
jgi:uncharacterized membrane protein YgcG